MNFTFSIIHTQNVKGKIKILNQVIQTTETRFVCKYKQWSKSIKVSWGVTYFPLTPPRPRPRRNCADKIKISLGKLTEITGSYSLVLPANKTTSQRQLMHSISVPIDSSRYVVYKTSGITRLRFFLITKRKFGRKRK